MPEELQKWFRRLYIDLERHPSPDQALLPCLKGPVPLSLPNGGVSSLHEATFSATVKLLRVFTVDNSQGLTSPFTGCSENPFNNIHREREKPQSNLLEGAK